MRTRVVAAIGVGALGAAAPVRAAPSELPPEVGYNYGQTETPRIAALGGALRATSSSTSALFINPANMAANRVYHLGAFAQIWPQARRQSYGGAIVDSIVSASRLAGGFGGTWTGQDPDGVGRRSLDLRFGLAYPFSQHFFLGAAGRYVSLDQSGYPRGPGGLRPSSAAGGLRDESIVKAMTFDAGLTFKPIRELSISAVGYNLTDPGHAFLPLMFGGGVGVGTEMFTIEANVLGDFTTWDTTTARAMVGAEVLLGGHVPLRAGYRYDDGAGTHTATGGIGYLDRAYSVDLSLQHVVSGVRSTAIIIGFTYHIESTGLTPGPDYGF